MITLKPGTPSSTTQQASLVDNPSMPTTSSPTNNTNNIKSEQFMLSSTEQTINSQICAEEKMALEGIRDRDSSSVVMRQNSIGGNNTCSAPTNTSSPHNSSDHSNSSSMSTNLTQAADSNADVMQDMNAEKLIKKKINIKEEDNGKSSTEKSHNTIAASKMSAGNSPTLTPVKDETEMINSLVAIKKEDNNMSPNMSPVGFGSIGGGAMNTNDATGQTPTTVKLELQHNDKLNSGLGSSNCADESSNLLNIASNDSCSTATNHHASANTFSGNNSSGNCLDYVQQQNHIFVFSTQLANKGADAVLNGQFPTIIAYHCTQPATKSFLEDFFMKNPMKMTKLQRQNSLNMCNMPMSGNQQQWLNTCNPMPKMTQKSSNSKLGFAAMNSNAGDIKSPSIRQAGMPSFPESSEGLANENDLMCWEQSRNNLNGNTNDIKLLDNGEPLLEGQNEGGILPHVSKAITDAIGDSSVPSLQGVKVPDENLTPQQRQHREEKLAQLKKMNQFLFPESGSGNEFRPDNPNAGQANAVSKLSAESAPGNMPGIMLNLPMPNSNMSQQLNSSLPNAGMRNLQSNLISQNKSTCNTDNITAALEDSLVSSDILGAHDINNLQCTSDKGSNSPMNQQNLQCGANNVLGKATPNINISSGPSNTRTCPSVSIKGPNNLVPHSPEVINSFNQNCSDEGMEHAQPKNEMHSHELNSSGMPPMEWSKLQNQFFNDKLKGHKSNLDMQSMQASICRSNQAGVNMRPNMVGSTMGTSINQAPRSNQGPPPPYHSTQRSASVPIATQSPNPGSPNNPTSNLSLPSPRPAGTLNMPTNSPNMDMHGSTLPTTTAAATITTATSSNSTNVNSNSMVKSNFAQEGSPTSGNANRNRNALNHFNSNPSTPLSHVSPKDVDSFNATGTTDLKSARPSPQRSRTPLINSNTNNNIGESMAVEGRFPNASPGLNFAPHAPGSNNNVNNFKAQGNVERHNTMPGQAQFCRRTDNLPLNPNNGRPHQNKLNQSFDPISSLAQMSQQLTSCVSVNNSSGGIPSIGAGDLNVPPNINQNMDGMLNTLDTGIDHCNTGGLGNMAMQPHMGGGGPFSNNCHMNSMLGPLGQRMHNPKGCNNFNNPVGGIREGPGNFHNVMPPQRMLSRMPFSNFNVSPNVQVKASTPNTIQYMPVRPQSNSNNIRAPPSLEFLQRYANPSMAGGMNVMENGNMGSVSSGPSNELSKIGMEQDEMGGGMMSANDMGMTPHSQMIRGLRPIRPHLPMSNPRMPNSGGNMSGMSQFPNVQQESIDCNDPNAIFSGPSGPGGSNQMFAGGQHKPMKPIGGLCQNINAPNVTNNGPINAGLTQNEHGNSALQSPVNNGSVILGPHSNIMNNSMSVNSNSIPAVCNGSNSNVNYKNFVGPASGDIKYAQQYHSFQQQLYATSTRNSNGGNNNIGAAANNNAIFFVNK